MLKLMIHILLKKMFKSEFGHFIRLNGQIINGNITHLTSFRLIWIRHNFNEYVCLIPVSYDHIQGVMALTLFEDFVYWTDGKSKSLRRAHKTTGAQGIELLNSWQAIKSIKVYHSLRQPEGMNCVKHLYLSCPSKLTSSLSLFRLSLKKNIVCVMGFLYFYSSIQCPSTSARLLMVDAATYVFFPLVGNTNVPAPQIFT